MVIGLRAEIARSRRGARGASPFRRVLAWGAFVFAASVLAMTVGLGTAAATAPAEEHLWLYHPGVVTYYGFVEAPIPVRNEPSYRARVVARLGTTTSDGTSMVVEAIAEETTPHGQWFQIHMPVLPNWRTGWVPRSALSLLVPVRTWLIIDTKHLRATLIDNGRRVFSAQIGIGEPSTPTPHGNFYVIDRLEHLAYGGEYGPLAFGTSARSPTLTDWPGGGVVGIHGTNQPQLIPGHPSHGCIRMRNQDIVRLGRLMPVGTPVTIE